MDGVTAADPPLGHRRRHFSLCGSTNDEAARLGREGAAHGTIVTADAQQAGRGRLGRTWHSPPGESLYLSVLVRPTLPPREAPLLTLCAGAALAATGAATLGDAGAAARVELKWPNDLLLVDPAAGTSRKVAGILTELTCRGGAVDFIVVGIGVNLNATSFPEDLAGRAGSLRQATGQSIDAEVFLERLLRQLDALYRRLLSNGKPALLATYRTYAPFLTRGAPLVIQSGAERYRGVPAGLDEDGALLLRRDDDPDGALVRVVAGEIA